MEAGKVIIQFLKFLVKVFHFAQVRLLLKEIEVGDLLASRPAEGGV